MKKIIGISLLAVLSLHSHDFSPISPDLTIDNETSRQSFFYDLVGAIREKNEKKIWQLLARVTSQELSMQDYGGRTLLMIAIESGQEKVALHLVELMDKKSLLIYEDDEQSAFAYACFYHMKSVEDAIAKKMWL